VVVNLNQVIIKVRGGKISQKGKEVTGGARKIAAGKNLLKKGG